MVDSSLVEFGRIGRPHGVRGQLRFFPHNPDSSLLSGPLGWSMTLRLEGQTQLFVVKQLRPRPKDHLLTLEGITTPEQAAEWTHAIVSVEASLFPAIGDDQEWYIWQLEGLIARDAEGAEVGHVLAVVNHGAGDLLVLWLRSGGGEVYLPFAEPWVGRVDVGGGYIDVDRLEDFLE